MIYTTAGLVGVVREEPHLEVHLDLALAAPRVLCTEIAALCRRPCLLKSELDLPELWILVQTTQRLRARGEGVLPPPRLLMRWAL